MGKPQIYVVFILCILLNIPRANSQALPGGSGDGSSGGYILPGGTKFIDQAQKEFEAVKAFQKLFIYESDLIKIMNKIEPSKSQEKPNFKNIIDIHNFLYLELLVKSMDTSSPTNCSDEAKKKITSKYLTSEVKTYLTKIYEDPAFSNYLKQIHLLNEKEIKFIKTNIQSLLAIEN